MNTEEEASLDLAITRAEELVRTLRAIRERERSVSADHTGHEASINRRQAIELMKSINYRIPIKGIDAAEPIWQTEPGRVRKSTTPRAVRHWMRTHTWNGDEWVETEL